MELERHLALQVPSNVVDSGVREHRTYQLMATHHEDRRGVP
jgi:hypothetical protein